MSFNSPVVTWWNYATDMQIDGEDPGIMDLVPYALSAGMTTSVEFAHYSYAKLAPGKVLYVPSLSVVQMTELDSTLSEFPTQFNVKLMGSAKNNPSTAGTTYVPYGSLSPIYYGPDVPHLLRGPIAFNVGSIAGGLSAYCMDYYLKLQIGVPHPRGTFRLLHIIGGAN